jgi:hypothetical protein
MIWIIAGLIIYGFVCFAIGWIVGIQRTWKAFWKWKKRLMESKK